MLLSELIHSDSDYELESALRAVISARRAGTVSAVSYAQLAKLANLDSLTKSAFDAFIEKHPELGNSIEQTSDNGIALADPSKEPEAPEPEEPEVDTGAEPEQDMSLAPDATDFTPPDLMAGTNTGAPLTPDTRVAPDQNNGKRPPAQEYDQVQKSAQRALGRRS